VRGRASTRPTYFLHPKLALVTKASKEGPKDGKSEQRRLRPDACLIFQAFPGIRCLLVDSLIETVMVSEMVPGTGGRRRGQARRYRFRRWVTVTYLQRPMSLIELGLVDASDKKELEKVLFGGADLEGRCAMHVSPSMLGVGKAVAIRQQLERGDSRVACRTRITSLELSRL
jgi:hypothetical protein